MFNPNCTLIDAPSTPGPQSQGLRRASVRGGYPPCTDFKKILSKIGTFSEPFFLNLINDYIENISFINRETNFFFPLKYPTPYFSFFPLFSFFTLFPPFSPFVHFFTLFSLFFFSLFSLPHPLLSSALSKFFPVFNLI